MHITTSDCVGSEVQKVGQLHHFFKIPSLVLLLFYIVFLCFMNCFAILTFLISSSHSVYSALLHIDVPLIALNYIYYHYAFLKPHDHNVLYAGFGT